MAIPRLVCLAASVTFMTGEISAQTAAGNPGRRFSLSMGLNRATFSGDDAEGAKARIGSLIGVGVLLPLGANVSFHPELMFSQKGARIEDPTGDGSIEMNYWEFPLTVRFELPVMGAVRPFIHGGPALAYQSDCGVSFSDGTIEASLSCRELADLVGDPSLEFKKFDIGALGGAGIAFDIPAGRLTTGVRYTQGLQQVASEGDSKHRVWSFVASLELPFKR